jgi:hypothetical protein
MRPNRPDHRAELQRAKDQAPKHHGPKDHAPKHHEAKNQAPKDHGAKDHAPARTSPDLHVCPYCGGSFVYPLDWSEEGPWHWRILLRCPECERVGTGVFPQAVVDRFDQELDRGSEEVLSDLQRLTHANMAKEIQFFIRALEADVIVPSDF